MRNCFIVLSTFVIVNAFASVAVSSSCYSTCVRVYAITSYAALVGTPWVNSDGWLYSVQDTNDYGTVCEPGGAAVELVNQNASANCALLLPPNGDYNASTSGMPEANTQNVNQCSVCQVGG